MTTPGRHTMPATITTLAVSGLGPHSSTKRLTLRVGLPPTHAAAGRPLHIDGPSQAGKSTALLALLLLLTGAAPDGSPFPRELINDDSDRADVAIVLSDGRRLLRGITRGRGLTAEIQSAPQVPTDPQSRAVQRLDSQIKLDEALGLEPSIVRAIVAPGEAVALARAGDRGRALRDLLGQILPPVDVGGIIGEWVEGLRPGEPTHEADVGRGRAKVDGAASRATAARKAEAQAQGAAAEAEAALAAAEASAPALYTPPDHAAVAEIRRKAVAATAWLAAAEAYAAGQAQLRTWTAARDRHQAREVERAAWQARLDALGSAPEAAEPVVVPQALVLAVQAAETQLHTVTQRLHAARTWLSPMVAQRSAALTLAREAVARAEAAPTEGACPTCGTVLSPQHAAEHLATLRAHERACVERLDREQAEAELERSQRVAVAEAEHAAATTAHATARQALDDARSRTQAAEGQARDRAQHARAVAALGPQPAAEAGPGPEPEVAPAPTPAGLEVRARAEAAVRAAAELEVQLTSGQALADAAAAAHAERLAAARERVTATRAAAVDAHQAVLRAERVLDAVRRAPTEAARRSAAALEDLLAGSGVAVRWGSAAVAEPEVELLIDGRPWWCASTGRQVLADLHLRLALRTLAHARYGARPLLDYAALPVVVDRAQDWSGAWPAVPGVWLIRTVGSSEGISVHA